MSVGDIMLGGGTDKLFEGVASVLGDADLLIGNCEGPIIDATIAQQKGAFPGGNMYAPHQAAAALAKLGFRGMTLANNHVMDFGPDGLAETTRALAEAGIEFTGAGASIDDAHRPMFLEENGTTVGVLSYTSVFNPSGYAATRDAPGVAVIGVDTAYQTPRNVPRQPGTPAITITIPKAPDMERLLADIADARQLCDVLIAHFHWGVAVYPHVLGYMRDIGRQAVDAGVDLVVGHHPHLLLGCEVYRGNAICYSLSHFAIEIQPDGRAGADAFGIGRLPFALETVVLKTLVGEGRIRRNSLIPVAICPGSLALEPASGRRHAEIRASMERLSSEFGTVFECEGDELLLRASTVGDAPHSTSSVYFDRNAWLPPGAELG